MSKKNRRLALSFDRLLSESLGKQMLILAGIIAVLFVVSFTLLHATGDDWIRYCDKHGINHWWFPLYLLIDANAFNNLYSNGEVPISRATLIISGITFVLGVLLFTGAFISILTNVISRRVESHHDGLIHYLKSGHYIIMGFDDMIPSVIDDIFKRDSKAFILLLSAVDAKTIREKLRKTFTDNQLKQIIINYGLRTSKDFYADIHLESAEEIFIVGNQSLPVHDAMNVECIDSICDYLKNNANSGQKPKRIICVFRDLDTYAAFKTSEIFKHVGDLDIDFIPYNFYSGWAHQVLLARKYHEKRHPEIEFDYPSLYGKGITENDQRYTHLVFVGITNLSTAFAIEAAHLLHFPNFNEETKRPKTRITFIDKVADQEMPEFITRNRHFFEVQSSIYQDLSSGKAPETTEPTVFKTDGDFLDIEFEFIKGDIFSQKVQTEISKWATDESQHLSIFLTMADQRKNFMMGMNMPDAVYDQEVPVFIRQDRSDNFVTNLRNADAKDRNKKEFQYSHVVNGQVETKERHGRYSNIYPFGMTEIAYYSDNTSVRRAKLINYLYATADFDNHHFTDQMVLAAMTPAQIWRDANEEWKKLTVALKWSNLYCAYSIIIKLDILRALRKLDLKDSSHDKDDLTQNEIDLIARIEHNRWNVEKLLMGYRKARKDEDKYQQSLLEKSHVKGNKNLFIHHDIRPFHELDGVQKMDFEISKYIPWILKMTE